LPVQFVVQNLDFDKLKEDVPKFMEAARNNKTFQNVDVNLKFNKPEVDITIDRIRARELGLTVSDIASVLQSAFSGRRLKRFLQENATDAPLLAAIRMRSTLRAAAQEIGLGALLGGKGLQELRFGLLHADHHHRTGDLLRVAAEVHPGLLELFLGGFPDEVIACGARDQGEGQAAPAADANPLADLARHHAPE